MANLSEQLLQGKKILSARPKKQNEPLCASLSQAGAEVYNLPAIEIVARPVKKPKHLPQFDWAIFTSANAVEYADLSWLNPNTQIAAVGAATKAALQKQDLSCVVCPAKHFGSDGLLRLPAFINVAKKNILIITGQDSRETLASVLSERKAKVTTQTCYQRKIPSLEVSTILNLSQQQFDFVICTSNQILINLHIWLGNNHRFLNARIVGFSARITTLAQQLGFKETPLITTKACNKAILSTIIQSLKSS